MMSRHALYHSLTAMSLTRSSPCGSNRLFLCVFYTTSKQFWRSAESRYVYLLPPHVSHMDDVAPCVQPFPYRFVVDQELAMWSKIVENGHFVPFFTPPRSSLRDSWVSVCFFTPPTRFSISSSNLMRLFWVSRCWRAASAQTLNQIIVVFEFSSLASCIKISDSFRQKIINVIIFECIIFECIFSKKNCIFLFF